MSSELSRQLSLAARRVGSYSQSALKPVESGLDPFGQIGIGVKGADSLGAATAGTKLVEKDAALRTYHPKKTVTNKQGVSMDITPIKTVTFQDEAGKSVVLEYADADLQKIVPT